MLQVNIMKLTGEASIPKYAKQGDAGMDLVATSQDIDEENNKIIYGTGLAIEIPEGYTGLIFPRSSIHKYQLSLANSVGVIDSGYRGEIKIIFKLLTDDITHGKIYTIGDRIAQLVILPYPPIKFNQINQLSNTERGTDGFGSSDS